MNKILSFKNAMYMKYLAVLVWLFHSEHALATSAYETLKTQSGYTKSSSADMTKAGSQLIGWIQVAGILIGLVVVISSLTNVARNSKLNQPTGSAWVAFGVGIMLIIVTVVSFFFAENLKTAFGVTTSTS